MSWAGVATVGMRWLDTGLAPSAGDHGGHWGASWVRLGVAAVSSSQWASRPVGCHGHHRECIAGGRCAHWEGSGGGLGMGLAPSIGDHGGHWGASHVRVAAVQSSPWASRPVGCCDCY